MGGGFSLSQVIINTSWELKGVGGVEDLESGWVFVHILGYGGGGGPI